MKQKQEQTSFAPEDLPIDLHPDSYFEMESDRVEDLTKWRQSVFEGFMALKKVTTWRDIVSGYDYRVYASREYWVCETVEASVIEVMP